MITLYSDRGIAETVYQCITLLRSVNSGYTITCDRRLSTQALSDEFIINKETDRKILCQDLDIRKFGAKILTLEQEEMRELICEHLLSPIRSDGRNGINRVITGDETWIF